MTSQQDAPTSEGFVRSMAALLQTLDENKRQQVLSCLDCLATQPDQQGQPSIVDLRAFVLSQTVGADKDTIAEAAAALQVWKKTSTPPPARKSDAPLNGKPLLDGRTLTWAERLDEKAVASSSSSNNNNNQPLIRNYAEACQIHAEYASLESKFVPDEKAADFPTDAATQRELVMHICDAITNVDDILEAKPPLSLKKAGANEPDTTLGTSSSSSSSSPPKPQKETISVTKVKSLARIEVEMLGWRVLMATRDSHRGHLPFLQWSKSDWGWDSSFATFRARLDAVMTTLRRSKAAVCSLLESDYLARLAAHPQREYRRKENNRSQNAERNAQVFLGRHAISTGQVTRDAGGHLCDWNGNVVVAATADHSELIEQTVKLATLGQQRQPRPAGALVSHPTQQPGPSRKRKPRQQQAQNAKRSKQDPCQQATLAPTAPTHLPMAQQPDLAAALLDLTVKADVDTANVDATGAAAAAGGINDTPAAASTPLSDHDHMAAYPSGASSSPTPSRALPLTPTETPQEVHSELPRATQMIQSRPPQTAAVANNRFMPAAPFFGYSNYAPPGHFQNPSASTSMYDFGGLGVPMAHSSSSFAPSTYPFDSLLSGLDSSGLDSSGLMDSSSLDSSGPMDSASFDAATLGEFGFTVDMLLGQQHLQQQQQQQLQMQSFPDGLPSMLAATVPMAAPAPMADDSDALAGMDSGDFAPTEYGSQEDRDLAISLFSGLAKYYTADDGDAF